MKKWTIWTLITPLLSLIILLGINIFANLFNVSARSIGLEIYGIVISLNFVNLFLVRTALNQIKTENLNGKWIVISGLSLSIIILIFFIALLALGIGIKNSGMYGGF